MCVCSGIHNDSKLRASASRASSSMRMAYSVAKIQTPMCMGDPPDSAGRGGVRGGRQAHRTGHQAHRAGHKRKMCVRRAPAARAAFEGQRAASGAWEGAAVGEGAERVPSGGDPAAVAAHGAARAVHVDGEVADDGPDAAPLLLLDGLQALDERRDGAEGDDVRRAERAAAGEVHGAHARLPGAEPIAKRCEVVDGHQDGKIASGMKAETIQFGASTISLILRSAATEQITYASSREKPRVSTRWSIMYRTACCAAAKRSGPCAVVA